MGSTLSNSMPKRAGGDIRMLTELAAPPRDEEWTLLLPDMEPMSLTGFPQTLREAMLLGAESCPVLAKAMKENMFSLADPSSMIGLYPFTGLWENIRVPIKSDLDLRCFFQAAVVSASLKISRGSGMAELAEASDMRDYSPLSFAAFREQSKPKEAVRINVGGQIREMHRMTASRIPLVAALLRFSADQSRGETPLFLDASPEAFDVVLEIARGRSRRYVQSLEPSLKLLVQEYSEYFGIDDLSDSAFSFRLSTCHPHNKQVINSLAYVTQQGTCYTTGVRPTWNTVVGDAHVPSSGKSYWEVLVQELGKVSPEFMVGVAFAATTTNLNQVLDAVNLGTGLYFQGAGNVFLRNGQQIIGATLAHEFPIAQDSRIGVMVDAERGCLMFFYNGLFKMSHPVSVKDKILLPAISVNADTTLCIKSGLQAPL